MLPITSEIINSSLVSGHTSDALKSALVRPIIKKPNLDQNVLEHAVLELPQLLSQLHLNDLHPVLQLAYRRCHSTETALLRVHNDLLRAVDDGNEALLILLDFSSAFDTSDHCLPR
ncbi:hypothetical protein P5673_019239 [Acropora cervicornis]|uniref:Reverse transcriptase domain-containing protein n=1 Tax=Acropora cervicornis TaxID=6130 RepID=A0AAD9QBZ1_ACRCE|nr:hypothetical protein P5673_019239 [Acropora cervicornis]